MTCYKRSPHFSVYIVEEHALWQQRDMMNIFNTVISSNNNKKLSAQFVVWIITLKICWCDDSNYGWYFMCGMLTVWISQTKMWRKRQALITEKLRDRDGSSEPFWLHDWHSGPESQRSVGRAEGWDVCSRGHWHNSLPSCQQEDELTVTAAQTPVSLWWNLSPSKRDKRQTADASNLGREKGEWKWNIQMVSYPLSGVSSETKAGLHYGLCPRINWPGSSSLFITLSGLGCLTWGCCTK